MSAFPKFKAACVQTEPKLADKEANLEKILNRIDKVAQENVKLAVFPELSLTGYNCGEAFFELAEKIPGPTTDKLETKAKEHNMYFVVGMPEEGDVRGVFYNTVVFYGPDGIVGKYRKTHLALYLKWEAVSQEPEIFRRGNKFYVYPTELGNIGMLICQDSDLSETWRVLTLMGAEIVTFSSASPDSFAYMWYHQKATMAYHNGIYIVACNSVGKESFTFRGQPMEEISFGGSVIVDPLGQIIAQAAENQEDIITAEIDLAQVKNRRHETKLLRDRRPELYGIICKQD